MSRDSITDHLNNQNYVLQNLSAQPQGELSLFDEDIAFFTTPFKRLGAFGWTRTGCSAGGKGQPVRPAQHSHGRLLDYRRENHHTGSDL